ncbi:MAG: family 10 glycosylhydrolase [Thermosynechococcaceae cyanobacterium]
MVRDVMNIRGVWLTNVASTALNSRDSIKSAMNLLASSGFNTVYPVVWNKGFTLYKSDIMRTQFGPQFEIDPFFASDGRDPLQEVVEEATAVGINVIPWFEYGFASSPNLSGGHLLNPTINPTAKPQWRGIDQNGNILVNFQGDRLSWMNAFDPEVQDFMISLMVEVVTKYDVTGVQGDDRLPGTPFNGGYDPQTKNLFKTKFGIDPPKLPSSFRPSDSPPQDTAWIQWRDFRANLLTDFLKKLQSAIKSVNSNLTLSMAPHVFPFGLNNLLQDTKIWVDQDLVDTMHPQIYRTTLTAYDGEIQKILSSHPSKLDKFAPGVAIKVGSINNGATEIQDIVKLNRNNGIEGEVFFFYEGLRNNSNEVARALRQGRYKNFAIASGITPTPENA